ncbi:PepSY-associated TM helix domain-containing protein [Xylophilus sp.]|uniref:PepSY-associated TM helix domain-containing protein n=1 Tax=Xylophilus sp. TaxID=2653893 RepID=UPI0013BD0C2B|nr:PepSY-associated TM helix domain-containing protein [Xylophilus sp.]KAF1044956.1 MAG: hypothetical protein GAK38_03307 [Xylophilus sp.]
MPHLRNLIRQVHLWLGLGVGAVLMLLGLTGAALVFYQELDAVLNPEVRVSTGGEAPGWNAAVWDDALATLRARWPQRDGAWRFEATGRPGALPVRYLPAGSGHHEQRGMVWLTPEGKRVLRSEEWGGYLMTWIYDLHMELMLKAPGRALVGWSGLASLVLLITGIWAWWPRGNWSRALRFKKDASCLRTLRDVHKLAGLAGFALLLMLSLTGFMLALPEESNWVLEQTVGPLQKTTMPASVPTGRPPVTVVQALAAAHAVMPHGRLAWVEVPGRREGAFMVRVQQPGDPSFRFPHSYVYVDQFSGRVLAVQDQQRFGAPNLINNWLHPLHDGSAGGLPLRILLCAAGLLPAVLWLTGWWRWRLRARAVQRSHRAVRTTAA